MASVRVRVNGRDCGMFRCEPFIADISNAVTKGSNTLDIELATTMVNAFGPNRRYGVKDDAWIGPHSFIEMDRFQTDYELFDFGLESVTVAAGG